MSAFFIADESGANQLRKSRLLPKALKRCPSFVFAPPHFRKNLRSNQRYFNSYEEVNLLVATTPIIPYLKKQVCANKKCQLHLLGSAAGI
jgi:hypothetical protein